MTLPPNVDDLPAEREAESTACPGLDCLSEVALTAWRPGRSHTGAPYLDGLDTGERIWLTGRRGEGTTLRGRLAVAHADHQPAHKRPSDALLKRAVDELVARAEMAAKDSAPPDSGDTGDGEEAPGAQIPDDLVPPPTNPMAVARHFLTTWQDPNGEGILRAWRGSWTAWHRTHWAELDPAHMRAQVYGLVEHAQYLHETERSASARPWAPTKRKVSDLLEALAAIVHLPEDVDAPSWTGRGPLPDGSMPPAGPVIACTNGLLELTSRQLIEHTPRLFNLVDVPFAYDPQAPEPVEWLRFLGDLWPDDPEAIAALKEWFGYVLSGRTNLQKILMIVGPSRAGKGTIARVLTALVGARNIASPTLTSLSSHFGIDALIGKPLAIIADARMGKSDAAAAVERLLSISGEDSQAVARKYRQDWIGRLPTRFVIMSNELPRLPDASGVIVHRLVLLSLTRSWLGKEAVDLEGRLMAELPGILNWSLDGLAELEKQGRLTEPKTSRSALVSLKDAIAPHSAFVRDRLKVDPASEVLVDDVWQAWRDWCDENGRHPSTKEELGRQLRTVVPGLISRGVSANNTDRRRRYVGIAIQSRESEPRNAPPRVSPASGVSEDDPADAGDTPDTGAGGLWHLPETQRTGYAVGPCHCGVPLSQHRESDLGSCLTCQKLTHRYGDNGRPRCAECSPATFQETA